MGAWRGRVPPRSRQSARGDPAGHGRLSLAAVAASLLGSRAPSTCAPTGSCRASSSAATPGSPTTAGASSATRPSRPARRLVHAAPEPARSPTPSLRRAVARARERGFGVRSVLAGRAADGSSAPRVRARDRDARDVAPARRAGPDARVARRASRCGRSSRPMPRRCTPCSTRRIVRGTAATCRCAHDDWLRWMTGDIEFDPTVWWLAERDGALAGCALHWRTRLAEGPRRARVRARPRPRRRARRCTGLAEFARRGVERVGLKVDAANPTGALRLYERLGFVDRASGRRRGP